MKRIEVGGITVAPVVEDPRALFDPTGFLPDLTPAVLEAERAWLAPDYYDEATGNLVLCVQGFVFETDGRTMLVDTCVGNDKQGRRRESWNGGAWPWLDELAAAGYAPEDIDVVMCTHLHVDHAGWNTRLVDGRWVPTFPNAEYLTVRPEMDSIEKKRVDGNAQYRYLYEDSVLPVIRSGQTVLVEPDHKVAPGVALEPTPGHTPGHVAVHLRSGAAEAYAIGDMMHHPLQLRYPAWNSRACEDPPQAARTRAEFLDRVADTGAWVMPAHFDPCRITREGGAYRHVRA